MSCALNHQIPVSQGVVPPETVLTWHSLFQLVLCLQLAKRSSSWVGKGKMIQVPLSTVATWLDACLSNKSQSIGKVSFSSIPLLSPYPCSGTFRSHQQISCVYWNLPRFWDDSLYPSWHLQSLQIFPLVFPICIYGSGEAITFPARGNDSLPLSSISGSSSLEGWKEIQG